MRCICSEYTRLLPCERCGAAALNRRFGSPQLGSLQIRVSSAGLSKFVSPVRDSPNSCLQCGTLQIRVSKVRAIKSSVRETFKNAQNSAAFLQIPIDNRSNFHHLYLVGKFCRVIGQSLSDIFHDLITCHLKRRVMRVDARSAQH